MTTVTAQISLTREAISEGKTQPPHTPIISEDLGEYVEPVFTTLSRTDGVVWFWGNSESK